MVAVVECHFVGRAVETPVPLTFRLYDVPDLRGCFLVDRRECNGAVLAVERQSVAYFKSVALFGIKILSHETQRAAKERCEQEGKKSACHSRKSISVFLLCKDTKR